MSYNKQLVNISQIPARTQLLKELGEPYKLEIIGVFKFLGPMMEDRAIPLHRLTYRDRVVLEKAYHKTSCDYDDFIESFVFSKDTAPNLNSWQTVEVIEIHEEEEENEEEKEESNPHCPWGLFSIEEERRRDMRSCDYEPESRSCTRKCEKLLGKSS